MAVRIMSTYYVPDTVTGAGIGTKFDGSYPQGAHSLKKRESIKFTGSYSTVNLSFGSQLQSVT